MSIHSWPSKLKARVGQRSINVMQILLIISLGSVVLLRDSLGSGIDVTLSTAADPVEASAISTGGGAEDFFGPKRNIASVKGKNGRELESVPNDATDPTDFSYEQPPVRKSKKPIGQVMDEDLKTEENVTESVLDVKEVLDEDLDKQEEQQVTEFDKARENRGRPRGKDVSKELEKEKDLSAEVKEHMFLTSDPTPREFTIPEDLQDSEEPVDEEEEESTKKHKKQSSRTEEKEQEQRNEILSVEEVSVDSTDLQKPENSNGLIEEVVEGKEEPAVTTTGRKLLPKPPVFAGEPFSFGKTPKNWDQQRLGWLEKYPWMKTTPNGKPRMLMITGSSPWACKNPVGDHLQLKSLKNKIDYARQHNIELFYNIAHLERTLTSYWAKLPILRKLMLTHPEIEWFFWMDADAIFTDMLFEIPIEKYENYNLIMWGWEENLYKNRSWIAVNDGAFFFRNCQWSLDLLDKWAPMGPEGDVRNKWGEFFSEYMSERNTNFPADDQSALVYLILTQPEVQSKMKLEWEYELSGYWEMYVEKFEEFMTTPGNHPGSGGKTWPFVTHFTGCQPCTGEHNPRYSGEECVRHMERAYNFADNQVLQPLGFMHEDLNSSHVKKISEDTDDYSIVDRIGPDTWTTATVSYGL